VIPLWKFILTPHEWTEIMPGQSRSGCVVVVAAETEAQAREIIAQDPDVDQRWIPMARVQRIDVTGPMLITLAQ